MMKITFANNFNSMNLNYKNNYPAKNNNVNYLSQVASDSVSFGSDVAKKTVIVSQNEKFEEGLHQRPANLISKIAKNFSDDGYEVLLINDEAGEMTEASDNLGLLSLGAYPGTEIKIEVSGENTRVATNLADAMSLILSAPHTTAESVQDFDGLNNYISDLTAAIKSVHYSGMKKQLFAKSLSNK